ncbi:cysteine desulfurase [Mariprofundus erugo]|uniref:cysteine desulfurase family protein n=1 Tax=Mariprofundus erugo TaxID=2528639 RepID=UPI0010FD9691|nr:cysteine desulfurase family protein [Mariprofundus erugo]TLS77932.1 cysteine desulfurase [Mariprofundus erugo]
MIGYLDNAASTPVDVKVGLAITRQLDSNGGFGNPSSVHEYGELASQYITTARCDVAKLLTSSDKQIVFTSGATESNNLALKGLSLCKHIITTAVEHKSIIASCSFLEQNGVDVTWLKPNPDGAIDLDELSDSMRVETGLVSIAHVNNETGFIQDISSIAEIVKSKGSLLHVDAAQSFGKLPIDLTKCPIDLLSISAHKIYGPKGVGALFVRKGLEKKMTPQMHGGGQELGLRSGTLPTHQIVGFGVAASIAQESMEQDHEVLTRYKARLIDALGQIGGMHINGDVSRSVPNILNISFDGVDSDVLIHRVRNKIAISNGSACNSGAIEPSYVLRAMGLPEERVYGAIRISTGRFTESDDIELAIETLHEAVTFLRS